VQADADGNFTGTYLVQEYDLYMKFIASAKGESSGLTAQTSFTDANSPNTTGAAVNPNPTNSAPTVTASVSEGGSNPKPNITAAEFFIDATGTSGTGTAMDASDGAFNSSAENVTKALTSTQFTGLSEGLHTVYVHGKDGNNTWETSFSSGTFTKDTVAPNINS